MLALSVARVVKSIFWDSWVGFLTPLLRYAWEVWGLHTAKRMITTSFPLEVRKQSFGWRAGRHVTKEQIAALPSFKFSFLSLSYLFCFFSVPSCSALNELGKHPSFRVNVSEGVVFILPPTQTILRGSCCRRSLFCWIFSMWEIIEQKGLSRGEKLKT